MSYTEIAKYSAYSITEMILASTESYAWISHDILIKMREAIRVHTLIPPAVWEWTSNCITLNNIHALSYARS